MRYYCDFIRSEGCGDFYFPEFPRAFSFTARFAGGCAEIMGCNAWLRVYCRLMGFPIRRVMVF